jgi:hypothetical protein
MKFRSIDAERFAAIGWMDWSGVEGDDFVDLTLDRLERLVEHGAKGIKFWKNLGLSVRDGSGDLLRVDDERLAPIFDKAAELGIPVMFHIADPDAFFLPVDGRNERFMGPISRRKSCLISATGSSHVIQKLLLSLPI